MNVGLEASAPRLLPAVLVAYALQAVVSALLLTSGLDEGNYLMKSWWYTTGRVQPYSAEDPTGYMPLVFYLDGWWQRLVGKGHLSVRALGSLLGAATVIAVWAAGRAWLPRAWHAVAAAALVVASPLAVRYLVWDPQFAAVSLISLGVLFVIAREGEWPWWTCAVLAGIGYFLLYFFRVTMLAGVALMLAYQLATAARPRWRGPAVSLAVAIALGASMLTLFADKLALFAIWNPVVGRVARTLGYEYPYAAEMASVAFPDWAVSGSDGRRLALRALVSGYLIPYLPVVLLTAGGLAAAVRRREVLTPGAFACAYFLLMSAIHFVGSQGYCRGCIQPYTNYFYAVGALGGAYALAALPGTIVPRQPYRRGLLAGATAWVGVVTAAALASTAFRFLTPPGDRYLDRIEDVAALVEAHVPEDAAVLAVGGLPYTTQGVFLGGRLVEITAINQDQSYYRVPDAIPASQRSELVRRLRELGLWTDASMEAWLRDGYEYVFWADTGESFQRRWIPVIERRFDPIAAIVVDGTRLVLSRRRDDDAREPATPGAWP